MKQYTYLAIDLGCILVPFLFSFYNKYPFYKQWRYFFPANIIVAIAFMIWDEYFTQLGVWGFNPDYLTGIYLGHLPLEEVLFFICIPYSCVFTFFALTQLLPARKAKWQRLFSYIFLAVLVASTLFFYELKYTFSTSVGTALFLILIIYKKQNLTYYYIAYFIILPFFFLSNGLLTGSFLDSPIVWYNDAENLGIRMFTIPVEDIVYGFLMIALNIYMYETFEKRFAKTAQIAERV